MTDQIAPVAEFQGSSTHAQQNAPMDIFAPWEELYGRTLSQRERRELSHNLAGFFGLLQEWKLKEEQGDLENAQEKSPGG